MANKFEAFVEAVEHADFWMNGSVVVHDEDSGEYEAIPGAYLTDISYTGSRHVVLSLTNGLYGSTGYSLEDDDNSPEDVANMLMEDEF